jgi:hypothetical protein
MNLRTLILIGLLLPGLPVALPPYAVASATWYVGGVSGSDTNNCLSPSTACKTIGHAISLASSGDSIIVASATYRENLTIEINLNVIGSGARTTIIDGGGVSHVVQVSSNATVTLSNVTIQNGLAVGVYQPGGGVWNRGTLNIVASTISGNRATTGSATRYGFARGGGIMNNGMLTISNSTLSGNSATVGCTNACLAWGGGILNLGSLTINSSTLSENSAVTGGAIFNQDLTSINNSTLSGNSAYGGGGIFNKGSLTSISNSTLSGNSAHAGGGGGILNYNSSGYKVTLENSIVADSPNGGNCTGTMSSNGYNLSSDGTCNFSSRGDLNNHDPMLGPLQNNGGPTQTMALLPGSPAIDGGNPSGCTDGQGNLLKTDQRGMPRPDKEDSVGCDMGAYESQSD